MIPGITASEPFAADLGLAGLSLPAPQMGLAFWNLYPQSYHGYCLRIERVSDNATQDIGFDGDGLLDVAAIAAFCGASNGRIFFWYDQRTGLDGGGGTTTGGRPVIYNGATGLMEKDSAGAIAWNLNGTYEFDLRRCAASSTFVFATCMTINDATMTILGDATNASRYMGYGGNGDTGTVCYNDNGSTGLGGPFYKNGAAQSIANRDNLHDVYRVNAPVRIQIQSPKTTLGSPTPGTYQTAGSTSSITNGRLAGYIIQWTVALDATQSAEFDAYIAGKLIELSAI